MINYDPDELRNASRGLINSALDTDGALAAFKAELAGLGQAFGNDLLGSLIGASYQAILEVAMECLAENLDAIDDYAERLISSADNLNLTDEDSADRSRGANSPINLSL